MRHIPYALLVLMITACAPGGGETLRIDTRQVLSVQSMPKELGRVLEALGYQWRMIADPETGQPVKSAQKYDYYILEYQYRENTQVRIDLQIKIIDGSTRLRFYELDRQTLSPASRQLLQKLRERLEFEFGSESVSG